MCWAVLSHSAVSNSSQTHAACQAPLSKETFQARILESVSESCSAMSDSLRPLGLYSPWNSPGQNNGVGSLSLLQGIFPIQGSNPGLLHCRLILCEPSHKGSPRILKWVAISSSRRSSWPRDLIHVSCTSCIGGWILYHYASQDLQQWWPRWETVVTWNRVVTVEMGRTSGMCLGIWWWIIYRNQEVPRIKAVIWWQEPQGRAYRQV